MNDLQATPDFEADTGRALYRLAGLTDADVQLALSTAPAELSEGIGNLFTLGNIWE